MPFFEAVRLALAQIRVQKLKSFFTLLGVMIGVMFLIAVVSIVQGMGNYVEDAFAGKFLGVNTFNVRRFPDFNMGDVTEAEWRAWQRRPLVTVEDAMAIRDALPAGTRWAIEDARWLAAQSPYVASGPQALVQAVTPEYFAIKNLVVTQGRAFNEQEDRLGAPVVVIGTEVAEHFFPALDPIGKELRIGGLPFRVIGVLEKQGTVFGVPLDRQVLGPFHSALHRFTGARRGLYGVVVQAPSAEAMPEVQATVRELMRRRHKLRPAQDDDFVLESSESALTTWASIKRYLVLAGIFLPAIGLVVGAMVIMNIMLVAVAERTREIGIRKSLGARRRDIMAQFLVEASTLSTFGAAIGIGLGIGLSKLVAAVSPLPASVATWSIGVAVLLGAGVGIVAGIYPAGRASRLDPVVALRAD
ncbi:MAG: ABC transporter permease [Gemmatimonadaceae bacterium]|nr:ABC transporter permease [Gemmatimonadaceae bacterium]